MNVFKCNIVDNIVLALCVISDNVGHSGIKSKTKIKGLQRSYATGFEELI